MTSSVLDDWRETLRHEFLAEEGCFLQIAQNQRRWDKAVFKELIEAMRTPVSTMWRRNISIVGWLTVFDVPAFVHVWTQQEEFHRPDKVNRHRAIHLLEVINHWFFWGETPVQEGEVDVLTME